MKKQSKNEKKPKHPGGRPSDYTDEKASLICQRVATHAVGLPTICKMYKDMPNLITIRNWLLNNEEFFSKYARAKMRQADLLAEECLDISDNSNNKTFAVDRLRIDTRKWLASKLLPKQYGDRSLLEQKTEENEHLKQELLLLRATLDDENRKEY